MRETESMRRPPWGFTLIELLVVVAIIGVLIAIVLGVAGGVTATGKSRLAADTIRVLESSLEDYSSTRGARPSYYIADPRLDPSNPPAVVSYFPIADARDTDGPEEAIINTCGLLVEQLREVSSAYANLGGTLSSEVFRPYSPSQADTDIEDFRQPLLPTAIDPWGNPIRYVHPVFDGLVYGSGNDLSDPSVPVDIEGGLGVVPPGFEQGESAWSIEEIRRNAEATGAADSSPANRPDSDGGTCQGDHPYFYSAGPDGDPSTVEDNVYGSSRPKLTSSDG